MDSLKALIREVPDFPKPGINFYDITTLLKDAKGFQLAVDAMTDMNADAHTNSVTRIFPRLGEMGTTAEIIALLKQSRAKN